MTYEDGANDEDAASQRVVESPRQLVEDNIGGPELQIAAPLPDMEEDILGD